MPKVCHPSQEDQRSTNLTPGFSVVGEQIGSHTLPAIIGVNALPLWDHSIQAMLQYEREHLLAQSVHRVSWVWQI